MASLTITNLTDHPDQISLLIDIYNGTLAPGETASIDTDQITDKIIDLAKTKYIAIGELPDYYKRWKYADDYKPLVFVIEKVEDTEPVSSEPASPDVVSEEAVVDELPKKKKGSK